LKDKKEARAEGGRRFQGEGPIRGRGLDLIVVLVRGTNRFRLVWERRGRRDETEVGWFSIEFGRIF